MSRRLLVVIFVLVLLAAAVWLLRAPNPTSDRSLITADLVLTGHRPDGSGAWTLEASSAEMLADHQELQEVRVTFFQSEGASIIALANQLVRTSAGSTLSGDVTVEGDDVQLSTEEMFWDERNDVLEAGAVHLALADASLSGNAFRHDLDAGLTMLSGGVTAELMQVGVSYVAQAASAEATSDRLDLLGDVTVEADNGDVYACERLTVLPDEDVIELSETVSGSWQSSTFLANRVRLDAAGVGLRGHVTIDLELRGVEPPS